MEGERTKNQGDKNANVLLKLLTLIIIIIVFLAVLCGLYDLSSPTGDANLCPLQWKSGPTITGLWGIPCSPLLLSNRRKKMRKKDLKYCETFWVSMLVPFEAVMAVGRVGVAGFNSPRRHIQKAPSVCTCSQLHQPSTSSFRMASSAFHHPSYEPFQSWPFLNIKSTHKKGDSPRSGASK